MKITKKGGKAVVQVTAEELKKNPKLAAALKKAQLGGGPDLGGAGAAGGLGGDVGGAGGDIALPGDEQLDGAGDLGGDVGGLGGSPDASTPGAGGDIGGDKSGQFTSAVDKAFQDAFGKPMDAGMKQVLNGLAQMAGAGGDELGGDAGVDDLGAAGDVGAGDDSSFPDPAEGGADMGGDAGSPIAPGGEGAGVGGGSPISPMAYTRGQLTKVASANDFVARLAEKLKK